MRRLGGAAPLMRKYRPPFDLQKSYQQLTTVRDQKEDSDQNDQFVFEEDTPDHTTVKESLGMHDVHYEQRFCFAYVLPRHSSPEML